MIKISNFKFQISNSIGFTLIELLIVISILGVLAALLISNVSGVRERARDTKRKSDVVQIKNALKMYYNDFDEYPESNGGSILGCGDSGNTACTWGSPFEVTNGGSLYMAVLPDDPLDSQNYVYTRISLDEFTLYANLENKSDKDAARSVLNCNINNPAFDNAYYVCSE